jgi:hypothetical protein
VLSEPPMASPDEPGSPEVDDRGASRVAPCTVMPGSSIGCWASAAGLRAVRPATGHRYASKRTDDERMTPLHDRSEAATTHEPSAEESRTAGTARRPERTPHLANPADRNAPRSGHDRHDTSLEHTSTSPLRWSARPCAPRGRWATGAGRSPGSRLMRVASTFPPVARQWLLGRRSPLTVAGAAAALRRSLAPRSLFTRQASARRPDGNRHARPSEANRMRGCQQLASVH